ncbi:uncharacterized protein AAEQ78_025598 [Lycaon pictus]
MVSELHLDKPVEKQKEENRKKVTQRACGPPTTALSPVPPPSQALQALRVCPSTGSCWPVAQGPCCSPVRITARQLVPWRQSVKPTKPLSDSAGRRAIWRSRLSQESSSWNVWAQGGGQQSAGSGPAGTGRIHGLPWACRRAGPLLLAVARGGGRRGPGLRADAAAGGGPVGGFLPPQDDPSPSRPLRFTFPPGRSLGEHRCLPAAPLGPGQASADPGETLRPWLPGPLVPRGAPSRCPPGLGPHVCQARAWTQTEAWSLPAASAGPAGSASSPLGPPPPPPPERPRESLRAGQTAGGAAQGQDSPGTAPRAAGKGKRRVVPLLPPPPPRSHLENLPHQRLCRDRGSTWGSAPGPLLTGIRCQETRGAPRPPRPWPSVHTSGLHPGAQ